MAQIPAMEAQQQEQQQPQQSTNDGEDSNESLLERYERAVEQLQQGEYVEAVHTLQELQESVARQSLFSFHNDERLDDMATSSIPLLQLEHDLALAYTQLPMTAAGDNMIRRQGHLKRAVDLWTSFLQKMQALELLSADEIKQLQELLELSEELDNNNNNNNNESSWSTSFRPPPLPDRDTKIARFRLQQQAQQERQRLLALQQRRQRLGLTLPDELDGQDGEELDRHLARTRLDIAKAQALEEWASTLREWPMLARMVREQQQPHGSSGPSPRDHRAPPSSSSNTGQGLEVTRITQDTTTGQLQMRREQLRATVFRPGWNQPTMTLDELAEREVRAAEERAVRQNEAESMNRPRRYDQLVKDGLEDDAALVDASAPLDRQWDAFKDENPRGSGNKRGDEGDRNF